MTITVTLLKITQIAGDPVVGTSANQAAEFAIQNDAVNLNWYRWSMGGIATGADVPTVLNANGAQLYSDAVANNAPTMTQKQVNVGSFAWQHWSNRNVFAIAQYTYTTGMLAAPNPPALSDYRTVLTNAFAELAPLTGTQFDTEFATERAALGVTTAIGSMTLAQCQTFATLLDRWLSARRVDSLWAGFVEQLA